MFEKLHGPLDGFGEPIRYQSLVPEGLSLGIGDDVMGFVVPAPLVPRRLVHHSGEGGHPHKLPDGSGEEMGHLRDESASPPVDPLEDPHIAELAVAREHIAFRIQFVQQLVEGRDVHLLIRCCTVEDVRIDESPVAAAHVHDLLVECFSASALAFRAVLPEDRQEGMHPEEVDIRIVEEVVVRIQAEELSGPM